MENPKLTYFSIADFIVETAHEQRLSLVIEKGYEPFILPGNKHKADLRILAHSGIQGKNLISCEPLFKAELEGKTLWEIGKTGNTYKFTVFSHENPGTIQQVALVNHDFSEWQIFMEPQPGTDGREGICPLHYPMGPLIMYYLTLNKGAIMLHASGVWDGEKGRAYSGFSGAGKSTLAKLWAQSGAMVINDDRLILRKIAGEYFMYNSPMFYADRPKKAKLHSLSLPFHSPGNSLQQLSGTIALAGIMRFCIQHGYKRNFLETHMDFLSGLCSSISIYELGFLPVPETIDFLKSHE